MQGPTAGVSAQNGLRAGKWRRQTRLQEKRKSSGNPSRTDLKTTRFGVILGPQPKEVLYTKGSQAGTGSGETN